MVLRSGSATDVGRVRTSNQDVALTDGVLFAVADGMGGHVGGEVAARVAVDALQGAFQRHPTVEGLRQAVAEANRAVWQEGQSDRGLHGMGTTLAATALIDGGDGNEVIALANVGDSRAYVFSKGRLIQVTADHSLAEEKVRQGQLTEAEAAVHPHRHILTRALGIASDVDVDLWELHLHPGDRILLCSDGLTNEVADDRIRGLLSEVDDPERAAERLVRTAVEHGGSDNVTVVVVDVCADASEGVVPAAGAGAGEGAGAVAVAGAVAGAEAAALADDGASGTTTSVAVPPTGLPRSPDTTPDPSDTGATWLGDGAADGPTGGTSDAASQTSRGGVPALAPAAPVRGTGPSGHLQSAELRRWQTAGHERSRRGRAAGSPRLITVRVVLFFVLFAAVLAGGYALLRSYAMNGWFVTVHHKHLAVYQGRPGGVAWFKPTLVEVTSVKTSQILPYRLPAVRRDKQEPSLATARRYVRALHHEYCVANTPVAGSTVPAPAVCTSTRAAAPLTTPGVTPTVPTTTTTTTTAPTTTTVPTTASSSTTAGSG